MSQNRSVSGAKPPEGPSPFKALRRQNGRFWPYPLGTRRISLLTALNRPCGGTAPRQPLRLFRSEIRHAPRPKPDTQQALGRGSVIGFALAVKRPLSVGQGTAHGSGSFSKLESRKRLTPQATCQCRKCSPKRTLLHLTRIAPIDPEAKSGTHYANNGFHRPARRSGHLPGMIKFR